MRSGRCVLAIVLGLVSNAPAADPDSIATMDTLQFRAPREKGGVSLVEGKVGKAHQFRFDAEARATFCTSSIRGRPEWDRAAGFSFWVKAEGPKGGDASTRFGGIEFIYDEDYSVRYDLAFPIKGKDWQQVVVAWGDLIPVLPGPNARPLGAPGGNRPSKLSGLWVGKWWYWGDYPPLTFAIDEIRLEPTIARQPRESRPAGPPLGRIRDKVRAGKPITIVTMGDSLTDKRHWANRETCWADLLRDELKTMTHAEVTIVNPAIGGTQLRQNLVLIPRWLAASPAPDLVTVFFGGNDWDAGMRGAEFERACIEAVDRIRSATRGEADVLILTTNPAASRWGATAELAEACRRAASKRGAGLADTEAAFLQAGRREGDRDRLFVDDRVHLSRAGHGLVADAVRAAIAPTGKGR